MRIKKFGVWQTAKVTSVIYFFVFLPFIPIFFVIALFAPAKQMKSFEMIFFLLMPFVYALLCFIFTAFGCWIYNVVAKRIGGVEIEVSE